MSPLSFNHNLMAWGVSRQLEAHYGTLANSVRRLSTGLRVEQAADDAAGLAIRELMRADIKALGQGARNANDAISLIQTADGALQIIDEKLIRMKELAEQAATGTYDSTQRLMIDSEFQQMASEIDRIAKSTDFNGVKLLDGSLSGRHDGSGRGSADGLSSTGALKVHFGTANDSAEDYYYVGIGDCTLAGLGLLDGSTLGATLGDIQSIRDLAGATDGGYSANPLLSGIIPMSYIPKGSRNVVITIDGFSGPEDDIQIFTRDGYHLAGTKITSGTDNDYTWSWGINDIDSPAEASRFMTQKNGFIPGSSYKLPSGGGRVSGVFNDGLDGKTPANWNYETNLSAHTFTIDGKAMTIAYSGDYDRIDNTPNDGKINDLTLTKTKEKLVIDEAVEDILVIISGTGVFSIDATWDYMPQNSGVTIPNVGAVEGVLISIKTQELAQQALNRLDDAIVRKDQIRAHLGATQNRLENTVTNLTVQAESLQAAESRISDVDVATEMTTFVRSQVLTQSATSMLAQANAFPHMLLQLLQG